MKKSEKVSVDPVYRDFLGAGLTVSYLEFVVIRPTPLWEGRYLVPLAGMIVANAMNSAALGVERFRSELELRSGRLRHCWRLGQRSSRPCLKRSRFLLLPRCFPRSIC